MRAESPHDSSRGLVTIMIPTYKQAAVVGQAIESALAQTYEKLEIIVADDASPDGTPEVAARYTTDPRVRYCRNEQRLGRVPNYRRTLYERARGQWCLNLDGDDYLTDALFIEDAMRAVEGRDDVVLVSAGQQILLTNGLTKAELPTRAPVEVIDGREFFLRPFGVFAAAHLSSLYRRDLALRIGFYRHDVASSDRESLWRLALHGKVVLFGRAIGVWRIHGGNTILNLSRQDITDNAVAILAPYKDALEAGVDRRRLDLWRDRSLAAYVITHAPLVAGGRWKDAWAVLRTMKPYPRAKGFAVARLLADPRSLGKWLLLAVGGERLFMSARSFWQRMTWQRQGHERPEDASPRARGRTGSASMTRCREMNGPEEPAGHDASHG